MAGVGFLARRMELLHHPNLSYSLTAFLSMSELKRTHAHIITSGLSSDPFTLARLLAAAAIAPSGDLRYAKLLFDAVAHPTLFMYNTMIRAFSQSPEPIDSINYYLRMLRSGISPDRLTFPFLLKSCAALGLAGLGRGVHCHAIELGLDSDVFILNNAIAMYSGWGDTNSAHQLFDDNFNIADVVSWTALITGYSNRGELDRARWFFDRMPSRNMISWNAMIAGYARSGRAEESWHLFGEMPERNVESWSSMISGFAQSGLCREALAVFDEMVQREVTPNEPTLVSVVSSCAQLRDLEHGRWVHDYINQHEVESSAILGTALVDMYGKCGSIGEAVEVFKKMPAKNVYSWNSMVTGLAMNGSGRQALALFWKMKLMGIEPNAITFVGLLSACSHSGLVDEGQRFFDTMTRVYGIRPLQEHYGCMVDLLGRAGLLKEALDFADRMPVEPHAGLWGALAGACRIHGDVELGEEVGKRLIELEPHHGGRYVLLANIYAAAKRWNDMVMVRKLLKERGARKVPGNSMVEALPAASM
ncbi:pentatricopeptide repeat-containing protein At5g66520-like [Phoenix dactylifera]|uniref:Pentatricopeptide repeat-containing protein At5g66520-like n=1 Tax=Phoenix dactylifera TaxID=42345 RepID=A0A8B7D1N1_PHODC|nr:pentatricopeptide repeat-containing protein At5g66520-like [Phoenix dactylifera]